MGDRTYYTGVTNDLARRVYEHKNKLVPGFTSKYNCTRLLYFQAGDSPEGAIVARNRSRAGCEQRRSH